MRVASLLLIGLAGCSYRGGFEMAGVGPHPPVRTQLGCLDLGVGMHHITSASAPVLRYGFGNRCDHRIRLELASLNVVGRAADGTAIPLVARDGGWLGPRDLGARWFAREVIRYQPAVGPLRKLHEVCIEVGRLHGPVTGDRWLCVSMGEQS